MDELDYTHLVKAHYEGLFRFALSLSGNKADACDLTQQTFYIWSLKGSDLRDPTKVKSWLFTTLYREFLSHRRQGTRQVFLEDLSVEESDPPAIELDLPSKLDAEFVIETLQKVDEIYRAPLAMFYLEDLSYAEIAEALEVPMGTVMSRLYRGKIMLRNVLVRLQSEGSVIPFPPMIRKQQS